MTGNHEKDECKDALGGEERGLLDEHGSRNARGYNFRGMVLEGDGAYGEGKMEAGFCCLQKGNVKGCIRVGRKQGVTSSSRPEPAALEIAYAKLQKKKT